MENYKEKYEHALENIKKIKNANIDNKKLVDFIEYEYPQLKDSDDERIRKELIKFIKSEYGEEARKEWIDYLEKKKEQNPVKTAKEMWKEMRLEAYAQASGNRHEPNYSDDSTKMFSLCDIDEIFEKIGNSTVEQKPAEWNDDTVPVKFEEENGENYPIVDYKLMGRKPTEWSEEDEEMLEDIKFDFVHNKENMTDALIAQYNRFFDKIKSLSSGCVREQYPIEDCDYGLEIALDILVKTLNKVQGYQTDDGIREHQTAIQAVKDAMKPWSYTYGKNETVDNLIGIAECLEMDGDCIFNGMSGNECGQFLRDLARKHALKNV